MDDVGDGASGFHISVCCSYATPDPVPCVNQPSAFVVIGVHDDRGRVGSMEQIYKGYMPQRYKCGLLYCEQGDY